MQLGDQLGAGLGVGPVDLDIHERFAPVAVVAERLGLDQAAFLVALHADHRVEQPVDDQAAPGDRAGDRIDQEGHVVIGDADPHPPLAELGADRFEPDEGDAVRPPVGAAGDELGRRRRVLVGEIGELAGQRALAQQLGEVVDQTLVSGIPACRVAGAASPGSSRDPATLSFIRGSRSCRADGRPALAGAYRPGARGGARLAGRSSSAA